MPFAQRSVSGSLRNDVVLSVLRLCSQRMGSGPGQRSGEKEAMDCTGKQAPAVTDMCRNYLTSCIARYNACSVMYTNVRFMHFIM